MRGVLHHVGGMPKMPPCMYLHIINTYVNTYGNLLTLYVLSYQDFFVPLHYS